MGYPGYTFRASLGPRLSVVRILTSSRHTMAEKIDSTNTLLSHPLTSASPRMNIFCPRFFLSMSSVLTNSKVYTCLWEGQQHRFQVVVFLMLILSRWVLTAFSDTDVPSFRVQWISGGRMIVTALNKRAASSFELLKTVQEGRLKIAIWFF